MLNMLFCMNKTTGEVWYPQRLYRLVFLINSGHNVAVVNAQIHKGGLGPIETSYSDAKDGVLNAQNHR